jgi:phosphoserine aminotransferase
MFRPHNLIKDSIQICKFNFKNLSIKTMVEGKTVWNFSAGPCALPKEVIKQAQDEILSWHGCGISPLEMSHRSKEFIEIHETAERDFRDFMSVPKNYKIFFFQGGATL